MFKIAFDRFKLNRQSDSSIASLKEEKNMVNELSGERSEGVISHRGERS